MSCCPQNSAPALSDTGGRNKWTTFGQTSLYVTGPAQAKVGILAFPDVLGPDSGRTKEDADALGALGYAVVLVDLVKSEYLTLEKVETLLTTWLQEYKFDNFLFPRIQDAMQYLREEAKVEHIASYGYCWGGWVGARLSAALNDPILKGNVSFHPSWKIENMLNGDGAVERLAHKVNHPQLLLSAGNDPTFVRENGSVHKILKTNANTTIAKYSNVVDFVDVVHGWVNRGDLADPATQAAVAKAWQLAIEFFEKICPKE